MARPKGIMLELELTGSDPAEVVSLRAGSAYRGVVKPRIHTKITDYPSKGREFAEFCAKYGMTLMPWQEWLGEQVLRTKPDGRWLTPVHTVLIARQNGKSEFMIWQILYRIFQIINSDLTFWEGVAQANPSLGHTIHPDNIRAVLNDPEDIVRTEVLCQWVSTINPVIHPSQWAACAVEGLRLNWKRGRRYIVRASNSATRGISQPSSIFLDEAREYHDEDVWSSLRYTQMAAPNPQAFLLSNAGDQHSIVLNKMRERALASILTDNLDLGWWEWSAPPEIKFDGSATFWEGVAQANPSLGHTIHPDNIRAVLNDPEDIVRTEVLCQWVSTINPVIHPSQWAACAVEGLRLNPSALAFCLERLSAGLRH